MILIYFLLGVIASSGNSFTKKVTDHIFLKTTDGLEEVLQMSSVLKLQSDSKMAHFKKKKKKRIFTFYIIGVEDYIWTFTFLTSIMESK